MKNIASWVGVITSYEINVPGFYVCMNIDAYYRTLSTSLSSVCTRLNNAKVIKKKTQSVGEQYPYRPKFHRRALTDTQSPMYSNSERIVDTMFGVLDYLASKKRSADWQRGTRHTQTRPNKKHPWSMVKLSDQCSKIYPTVPEAL